MFGLINKALDGLYKTGAVLAGCLLVLLCCLVLFSTFSRSFGLYAGGASDMAGYVMTTSTFMALAYTLRSNRHIRISLFSAKLSGIKRHILELCCLAILVAAAGFLAFYMIRLTTLSYEFQDRSQGADGILLWIPQTFVAVGSTLFALASLHTFLQCLCGGTPLENNGVSDEGV